MAKLQSRNLAAALVSLLALTSVVACTRPADTVASDEASMREGIDALYGRHDPRAAAAAFRAVLERNPTHYGATFQLASALDQSGADAEARLLWVKVLQMADTYNDSMTAETAWARIASPDAVSAAAMQAGLDALYTRRDGKTAARFFRSVLKRSPTHYGATYQLAAALDAAGRPHEARPWWEKVLALAERSGDQEIAERARARLAESDVPDAATLMRLGVDALYEQHDADTAAGYFHKVLEQKPSHYGAHYQLAAALDAAGKPEEARGWWEQMLAMATATGDNATADTARERLQKRP